MPALELDNGDIIAEITCICEYLDDRDGGSSLIGTTPEERAETRMWVRRIDLESPFRASDIVGSWALV